MSGGLVTLAGAGVIGLLVAWRSRCWQIGTRRVWPYVWILTGLVAIIYSSYALWLHSHYNTHGHDLGIYDQLVWHLSRLEAPITTVRRGPIISLFGDHFDPIMYLLAPVYAVFRSPAVLLIAQALLFSALLPLLFILGTKWRIPPIPALMVAACFTLNPGIFLAVNFDFHDYAFVPMLLVCAMLAATAERWRWYWAAIIGLLLTKEPLGIYVTLFGLMLLLQAIPFRRAKQASIFHGLITMVVGVGAFFLITRVVIPFFSPDQGFVYWKQYAAVGETPMKLAVNMIIHPINTFGALVDDPIKQTTMKYVLASAGFVPLLSWTAWPLLLAGFGERFWSNVPGLWMMQFHYALVLVGIMSIATLDALRKIERHRWGRGVSAGAVVVMIIMTVWVYGKIGLEKQLTDPNIIGRPISIWNQALRIIPAQDAVSAQDAFVPHLTRRAKIYQYPNVVDARWIVLDPLAPSWPLTQTEVTDEQVKLRSAPEWELVFSEGSTTVFRRQ